MSKLQLRSADPASAVRALQAQARCLVKTNAIEEALHILTKTLAENEYPPGSRPAWKIHMRRRHAFEHWRFYGKPDLRITRTFNVHCTR